MVLPSAAFSNPGVGGAAPFPGALSIRRCGVCSFWGCCCWAEEDTDEEELPISTGGLAIPSGAPPTGTVPRGGLPVSRGALAIPGEAPPTPRGGAPTVSRGALAIPGEAPPTGTVPRGAPTVEEARVWAAVVWCVVVGDAWCVWLWGSCVWGDCVWSAMVCKCVWVWCCVVRCATACGVCTIPTSSE